MASAPSERRTSILKKIFGKTRITPRPNTKKTSKQLNNEQLYGSFGLNTGNARNAGNAGNAGNARNAGNYGNEKNFVLVRHLPTPVSREQQPAFNVRHQVHREKQPGTGDAYEMISREYLFVEPDIAENLTDNAFINSYNTFLKEIVNNVNNTGSPDFKLKFSYNSPSSQSVVVGKIANFKNINLLKDSNVGGIEENYLQNLFFIRILEDFLRATSFYKFNKKNYLIRRFDSDEVIKKLKIDGKYDMIKYFTMLSKILQVSFGVDEFQNLGEEDFFQKDDDLNLPRTNPRTNIFLSEILVNKPKLKKIINALYIMHQGYMTYFMKYFIKDTKATEEEKKQPGYELSQVPSESLLIFDSENKIVSLIFYLKDTESQKSYAFQRGILIISTHINSTDNNNGYITYIPFTNSIIMNPIDDLYSIPTYNYEATSNLYFNNFIKYYNLLLKTVINLINNINILDNLNDIQIDKYLRINEKGEIQQIPQPYIQRWNDKNKIVNYYGDYSKTSLEILEDLLAIIQFVIGLGLHKNILTGLGFNVNIFITKSKFLFLISKLLQSSILDLIIKKLNFLDIIQINNLNLKILNFENNKYNELSNTIINIPKIPGNINFNFIFTTSEVEPSETNEDKTLNYDEYSKILSMSEAINEFMNMQTYIHIPFCSFHNRDILIASLFSKIIKNFSSSEKTFRKLVNDSNLDKVFMYSLLNNIYIKQIKKQTKEQTKEQTREITEFLQEFIKHRHLNISLEKYNLFENPVKLLENINIDMDSEFSKTEYLDEDYDIFKSYGIDLHLYKMVIHQQIHKQIITGTNKKTSNVNQNETEHETEHENITLALSRYRNNPNMATESTAGGFYKKKLLTKKAIKKNKNKSKINKRYKI